MTTKIAATLALAFGLTLAAPRAHADEAPPPKKEAAKKAKADAKEDPEAKDKNKKKGGTAKVGDACKTSDDCDQSERDVRCQDGKCKAIMSHPVT